MKKTLRLLGLALMAIMFTAGLSACSDNDDDKKFDTNEYTGHDTALVGTWVKTETGTNWSDTETITFNSDGTYEENEVEIKGQNEKTSWEKGTWKTNSAKTKILFRVDQSSDPTEVGDQDVETYMVASGVLTLDKDVYLSVQAE